ncbi:MAG: TenA family protein [Bacteroidales bacterium]|jgi:thiaminase/transcriptional activator TenA
MNLQHLPHINAMWNELKDIFSTIVSHDFIIGLSEQKLSLNAFKHYLQQDALYLIDDAISLQNLSDRSTNEDYKRFFAELATDSIEMEKALHEQYYKLYDVKATTVKSEAISQYTEHLLLQSKNAAYPEACAALLPCFWIYTYIGKNFPKSDVKDNIYQEWINTYKSDLYYNYTMKFLQICDVLAAKSDKKIRKNMLEMMRTSCLYELAFFDESVSKS